MRIFSDISIRIKVLIAPVIMILTLGVILFIAISGMENQRKVLTDVQEISLKRLQLVQEFITTSELVQSDVYRLSVLQFMQSPETEVSPVSERLNVGLNNLTVINGEILTKWSLDENEKALLQELNKSLNTFRHQVQQAVKAVSENPSFGILFVRSAAIPFNELRGLLSRLLDYQNDKIAAAKQHSEAMLDRIRKTIISIAVLMALMRHIYYRLHRIKIYFKTDRVDYAINGPADGRGFVGKRSKATTAKMRSGRWKKH